jgi:hypothetical protein
MSLARAAATEPRRRFQGAPRRRVRNADLVRAAYRLVLHRDPDPEGIATWCDALQRGVATIDDLGDELVASAEFEGRPRHPERLLPLSLHWSRRDFVRSLPPARMILDIGGSWKWSARGAFLELGYPYDFDQLVIVDLPSDERHESYRSAAHDVVVTDQGEVRYDYRSMTDLGGYPANTFDLVYSGQSIEHIPTASVPGVLHHVLRVLRPGGAFALDTPNGRVCRLQQAAFIDPDHEAEYTVDELGAFLCAAGFEVTDVKGLNYVGGSVRRGSFSAAEAAANRGVYGAADECYLLAMVARKPGIDVRR